MIRVERPRSRFSKSLAVATVLGIGLGVASSDGRGETAMAASREPVQSPAARQVIPPPTASPSTAAPQAEQSPWPAAVPADLDRRVNRALGKIFRDRPKVVVVERAAMVAAIQLDQTSILVAGLLPEASAKAAVEARAPELGSMADAAVAYYSLGSKSVLLRPAVIDQRVASGAVPAAEREHVLALAVAREFARCMQDQEIGLARFLAAPGVDGHTLGDEAKAVRSALSIGQALLVQELVAEQFAAEDQAWAQAKAAADRLIPDGAAATDATPAARQRAELIHRGGLHRMRATHALGGAAATWKLFSAPPADLASFAQRGEIFDTQLSQRMASMLEGSALGDGWSGKGKPSTPLLALSTQLAALTQEAREELVGACRGVAAMAGVERKGGRAAVVAFRAVDEGSARLIWTELGGMNAKAMQLFGMTAPERLERDEGGVTLDVARQEIVVNKQKVGMSFTRAMRGQWVVQYSLVNADRDTGTLAAIAVAILDSVARADAGDSGLGSPGKTDPATKAAPSAGGAAIGPR